MIKPGGVERRSQPLSRMRASILRDLKSLLVAIEREASIPGLLVDFYSGGFSMQLNGLFLGSSVLGMLDGKDRCAGDMVFSMAGHISTAQQGFRIMQLWLVFSACIPIMMSKVVTQHYGRGWSVGEPESSC